MRQYYKSLLTSFIIVTLLIVSDLLLFGMQAEPTDCQPLQTCPLGRSEVG